MILVVKAIFTSNWSTKFHHVCVMTPSKGNEFPYSWMTLQIISPETSQVTSTHHTAFHTPQAIEQRKHSGNATISLFCRAKGKEGGRGVRHNFCTKQLHFVFDWFLVCLFTLFQIKYTNPDLLTIIPVWSMSFWSTVKRGIYCLSMIIYSVKVFQTKHNVLRGSHTRSRQSWIKVLSKTSVTCIPLIFPQIEKKN